MSQQEKIISANGEPMLSARRAARLLDCAPDYVSKLCREGKLTGKRVDNAWFVDADSITQFSRVRDAARQARAISLAQERKAESERYRKTDPITVASNTSKQPLSLYTASFFGRNAALALGSMFLIATIAWASALSTPQGFSQSSAAALAQIESPFFGSIPSSQPQPASSNFFSDVLAFLFGSHSAAPTTKLADSEPINLSPEKLPEVASSSPAQTPTPKQTIVENITQPVVEHTVVQTVQTSGITQADLTSQIDELSDSLKSLIYSQQSAPNSLPATGGYQNEIALSQQINSLSGVSITGGTITGATISNANGDFTGTFTSTNSATSTFQNGIDLASGCFSVNGVCISGSGSAAGPDGALQFSEGGNFTATTSLAWDNQNGYLKIESNDGSSEGCLADIGGQLEYSNDCNTFQGFTAAAAGGWTDTGSVVRLTTDTENVAVGTSTPYAKFTVWGPDQSASTDAFAIVNAASTTLLSVNDAGQTSVIDLLATGSTTLQNVTAQQATTTNATSTTLYSSVFGLGGSYLTSLTGAGLTIDGSALSVATSSLNLTTSGIAEGSNLYYTDARVDSLINASSTIAQTSAAPNYGQVLVGNTNGGYNLVATSSLGIASAVWGNITGTLSNQVDLQQALTSKLSLSSWYATTTDALAQGSTNLYYSNALVNALLNASTTIVKAPAAPGYGQVLLGNANGSYDLVSTSSLGIASGGGLSFGYPFPNNATSTLLNFGGGLISSASSTFTSTLNANTLSLASALSVANGGTGTSTTPAYGQLLVGNSLGGYNLVSTSSLGIQSGSSYTFSYPLQNSANNISLAFGTTTANSWSALQQFNGNASTTALTVTGTASTTNLVVSSLAGAGTDCVQVDSQGRLSSAGAACGTGSGSVNSVSNSDGTLTITPTSGAVVASLNLGNANTWSALQTFGNILLTGSTTLQNFTGINATTTNATTTDLAITNVSGSLLKTLSDGAVVAAIAGVDYATPSSIAGFEFTPTSSFGTAANATSTLIGFNNGLYALGSSTIANLTTNNATTTNLVLSNLIAGTSGTTTVTGNLVPSASNTYSLGSAANPFASVYIGNASLYVNGQEVVHTDVGDNVVVSADSGENLIVKSQGSGSLQLDSAGSGNIQLEGATQITGGDAFTTSNGTPVLFTNGTEPGNLELTGNTIAATNTNGGISLTPAGSGGTYVTTGDFGIGTTSPTNKLEVNGSTYLGGSLTTSGTTTLENFGPGLLKTLSNGAVVAAQAGVDYQAAGNYDTFGYEFPSNATSTLLSFNGGLTSYASTTIGNGNQTGGLTINGGATTTGNAYFAGNVGIGTSSPFATLSVNGSGFLGGNLTASNIIATGTVQAVNILATGSTTLQNFTAQSATTSQATTTNLAITGISGSLLKTLSDGAVVAAVAGTDYDTFGYEFPSNATSTKLTFSGGLLSLASTTIGNGTQNGGLTINGGATTTGNLIVQGTGTSTFAGSVSAPGFADYAGTSPYYPSTGSPTTLSSTDGQPNALAEDSSGNIYAANYGAGTISKITPGGSISAFATVGSEPIAIVMDASGNFYTANYGAGTVSKITPGGSVSTFATVGNEPAALAFDASGNLYVANEQDGTISKITSGGSVSTFASGLSYPDALAFDASGNLYVASYTSGVITKITSGGGTSSFATVGSNPRALIFDASGNLYSANYGAGTISKITSGGSVSTFATVGSDPRALAFDGAGNLYVANQGSNSVSRVTPGGSVTTYASTSNYPEGILYDASTGDLYTANYGSNNVTKITGIILSSTPSSLSLSAPTSVSSTFAALATSTFGGNVGIGTTSPFAALSVNGSGFFGGNLTASNIVATATLQALNILATGSTTLQNFTAANATTSQATTTNLAITGVISSLLKTDANGAVGAVTIGSGLTFDGTTLAASGLGITSIGPAGQLQTGGTQTLATSTSSSNGLTVGMTIVGSGNTQTFTPTITGTLNNAGLTNSTISGVSLGGNLANLVTDNTLVGGTYNGSTTSTFGINLANSDWWSALQNFTNASTSQFTATSSVYLATVAGQVGIGNTNPGKTLDVTGTGRFSSTLTISGTASCSGSSALQTDSSGDISCGTVSSTGINTAGGWTTNNIGLVTLATTTNQVLIGAISTSTSSQLEVHGGASFDNATTTNLAATGVAYFSGTVGIGTSSPLAKLSVSGGDIFQAAAGNPTLATSVPAISGAHSYDTFVSGNYAYEAEYEGGLRIFDISNPQNPTLVGTWSGDSAVDQVIVAGKYAYIADASQGLAILDVSNPSSPTLVGSYSISTLPYSLGLALSGSYLYATDLNNHAVRVINISNPASPSLAGTYSGGGSSYPRALAVNGSYLYVADYNGSVYTLNIGNPAAPVKVGSSFTTGLGGPNSLYVSGGYLYVSDVGGGGLTILNASNPASLSFAGVYNPGGNSNYEQVSVAGNYAYLTSDADTLVQVDISNKAAPSLVGSYSLGGIGRSVTVAGKYAYVSADSQGLEIVDINGLSTPAASIGSVAANTANISDSLNVGQDIYAGGGLDVGSGGIFSRGSLSVFGTTTLQNFTALAATTTNATTTNFAILSATSTLLKANALGQLVAAVAGTDYQAAGSYLTSIGPAGQTTSGPAVTFASTTSTFDGLTSALTITGSGSTLTYQPSLSGTLSVAGGGTGMSSQTTNGVTYFDGTEITSGSNLVFNGTNFGVGTSTPGSLLSIGNVNGINFTTATSTFNSTGGINLSAGCYAIGGTCLSSGVAGITSIVPYPPYYLSTGVVSTFASGFSLPYRLAFDASDNLYVSDATAGTITKITPGGSASTFASGLSSPQAMIFDTSGNLYVSTNNSTITEITPSGTVSTFATGFSSPFTLLFDTSGNLYVSNDSAYTISEVTPSGTVSTFATLGSTPTYMAFDTSGNLYVVNGSQISEVTPGGSVSTFASGLSSPTGIAFDTSGNLYAANYGNSTISKITSGGSVSTFASGLSSPAGIAFDGAGNLYVENNSGGTVSKITPGGTVSTFASGFNTPRGFMYDPTSGNLYEADSGVGKVFKIQALIPSPAANGILNLTYATNIVGAAGSNVPIFTISTSTSAFATSTAFTIDQSGNVDIQNGASESISGNLNVLGNIGASTSTPWARLSVDTSSLAAGVDEFVVGSSTRTDLQINQAGQVQIGGTASSSVGQLSVMAGASTISRMSHTALGGSNGGNGLFVQGRYAYIAQGGNTSNAFKIYDVSTSTPALVFTGNLTQGSNGYTDAISVQGHYAYIAEGGGTTNAFQVFDVSSPASTTLVFQTNLPNTGASSIYVQGRYAYIVDGTTNGFNIYDISNPAAPVRVGQSTLASGYGGITIQGRYAYIAEDGTTNAFQVFDISNPAAPVLANQRNLAGAATSIYVQGDLAYIPETSFGMEIFNISNAATTTLMSKTTIGTFGVGSAVSVQGRYAYVAETGTTGAFETYDVSNPTSTLRVSQNNLAGGVSGYFDSIVVQGRYAYVTEGYGNNFEIFDLGGEYAQQLEAGGIETGTLSVRNNLQALDGSFSGGLNVGQSLSVTGSGSFVSATSTYNTTSNIFNITTASSTNSILSVLGNGAVGIGTSTPYAALTIASSTGAQLMLTDGSATSNPWNFRSIGGTLYISTSSPSTFATSSIPAFVINSSGNIGIGTSTPYAALTIASSTGAQLMLTDGSATSNPWNFRSIGGTLYISTSSPSTFATSSIPAFTINSSGNVGIGTSSPFADFSLQANPSRFINTTLFAIGSSTSAATTTLFSISNTGSTTISNGVNVTAGCYAINGTCLPTTGPTGSTGQVAYFSGTNSAVGTSSLYISTAGNIGVGTTTPIDELQVAGLATPTEASSTTSGLSGPHSVYVSGRYAYVTNYSNNSLVIFDISNPASPTEVGSTTSGLNEPYSVYVSGRYAYVASVGNSSLVAFDISNPASPVEVGSTTSGLNSPISVYVSGRYAYVASEGNSSLVAFDISNPASPTEVGSTTSGLNEPYSVYVSGRYAYVASVGNSSLVAFDISNPASPVEVGSTTSGLNEPFSVYVSGRYAYVTNYSNNSLVIFDISNPASPVEVGSTTSGLSDPTSVYVSGRYAYVASAANSSLVAFDISNPASPTEVGSTTSGLNEPFSVYVSGRYAYVASVGNSSLVTFQIGGEYTQSLEAGTLQAGSLELDNNLQALDGSFSGGLNVGQSLSVTGSGSFVSATSTYNTTSNIFNITTASSTNSILSVLGNGAVGIGTTTPWGKLSVDTSNLAASVPEFDVGSSTRTDFTITQSGFVGIGTTSPQSTFTVYDSTNDVANDTGQIVAASNANNAALSLENFGAGGSSWQISSTNNGSAYGGGKLLFFNAIAPKVAIDSSGNVGIGTTSPFANLSVQPSTDGNAFAIANASGATDFNFSTVNTANNIFEVATSTGTAYFDITSGGNVGIGTTSPASTLTVDGSVCIDKGATATVACGTTAGNAYGTAFNTGAYDVAENYLTSDIPTTTPGTIVALNPTASSTVETAQPEAVAFGVVSTNPGVILGGADATMQDKPIVPVALSGRVPVTVDFEGGSIAVGDPIALSSVAGVGTKATTTSEIVGFALESATSTVSTSSPQAAMATTSIEVFIEPQLWFAEPSQASVFAEFASTTQSFSSALTSVLSSLGSISIRELGAAVHATVGVFNTLVTQTLTAQTITADTVNTKELCVGDDSGAQTCITKSQLDALLSGQGNSAQASNTQTTNVSNTQNSNDSNSSADNTTPPIVSLNGDNPATVNVGDVYTDLGGTASGPGNDSNLQLWASVDGAASTTADQIQIDTSAAGTHTIIYSATDQNGLTGYATRTVNVVAPQNSDATSTDASTTSATSTTP